MAWIVPNLTEGWMWNNHFWILKHVTCKLIDFEVQRKAYNIQWWITFLFPPSLSISFFHCWKHDVCLFKLFWCSPGNFFLLICMLFSLLKYLEISLVSQPSPMQSVILLIVGMFLPWSSNPWTDNISLTVHNCSIKEPRIRIIVVGELHQIRMLDIYTGVISRYLQ